MEPAPLTGADMDLAPGDGLGDSAAENQSSVSGVELIDSSLLEEETENETDDADGRGSDDDGSVDIEMDLAQAGCVTPLPVLAMRKPQLATNGSATDGSDDLPALRPVLARWPGVHLSRPRLAALGALAFTAGLLASAGARTLVRSPRSKAEAAATIGLTSGTNLDPTPMATATTPTTATAPEAHPAAGAAPVAAMEASNTNGALAVAEPAHPHALNGRLRGGKRSDARQAGRLGGTAGGDEALQQEALQQEALQQEEKMLGGTTAAPVEARAPSASSPAARAPGWVDPFAE